MKTQTIIIIVVVLIIFFMWKKEDEPKKTILPKPTFKKAGGIGTKELIKKAVL